MHHAQAPPAEAGTPAGGERAEGCETLISPEVPRISVLFTAHNHTNGSWVPKLSGARTHVTD